MLEDHRGQFGVDLAEDAVGLAAALLVEVASLFQRWKRSSIASGRAPAKRLPIATKSGGAFDSSKVQPASASLIALAVSPSRWASASILARHAWATRRGTAS